jgi:hypothetical protein
VVLKNLNLFRFICIKFGLRVIKYRVLSLLIGEFIGKFMHFRFFVFFISDNSLRVWYFFGSNKSWIFGQILIAIEFF